MKTTVDIRPMKGADAGAVKDLMRVFYASDAVLTNGSDEIFDADIAACISESPYAEGFVFEEAGAVVGYAMLAKSFSTEFGKPCVWVEDLFFCPAARGKGYAARFFDFLKTQHPDSVLRLEVEEENRHAIHVYRKNGFEVLPYSEMICHIK